MLTAVKDSCTKFLGRYDPVTTGIGSLLVTGYCVVVHGQDVGEALNIAAFATILGMVSVCCRHAWMWRAQLLLSEAAGLVGSSKYDLI